MAMDETAVNTALTISFAKLLLLSTQVAREYRILFKYVKALKIDEVGMISTELLDQIYLRLKEIADNVTNLLATLI